MLRGAGQTLKSIAMFRNSNFPATQTFNTIAYNLKIRCSSKIIVLDFKTAKTLMFLEAEYYRSIKS